MFRREYKSDANRMLGKMDIDPKEIDLFVSCVSKQRMFGLSENTFGINQAVRIAIIQFT